MKASELIQRLQSVIEKHGDVPVGVCDDNDMWFTSITTTWLRSPVSDVEMGGEKFIGLAGYELGDWHRQLDNPNANNDE